MKKKSIFNFLPPLLLAVAMMFSFSAKAETYYVKPSDANSDVWATKDPAKVITIDVTESDANRGLALSNALYTNRASGDTVWIAAGEYLNNNSSGINMNATKTLCIYGGFSGTEDDISDREMADSGDAWDFKYPTTIKANSNNSIFWFGNNTSSNITIDGLILDGNKPNFTAARGVGFAATGTTSSTITVSHCHIKNCGSSNAAAAPGGGIHALGKATIEYCLIENCEARRGSGSATTYDGGGIYIGGANSSVANCVIRNNTAMGKGGGVSIVSSNSTINNCTIENNTSPGNGGGISISGGSNSLITNCIIRNNKATGADGGGLDTRIASGTVVSYCIFDGNETVTNGGGGIYADNNVTVHHCTIRNNKSSGGGGGISANGLQGSFMNVYNCLVENNTATNGTGGINGNRATIYNCLVVNNTGGNAGGIGLDIRYASTVYNNTVVNNKTTLEDDADNGNVRSGGLVFYNNTSGTRASSTVYNTVFWNNKNKNGEVVNFAKQNTTGTNNSSALTANVYNCLTDRIDYADVSFTDCIVATEANVIFTDAENGDYTLKVGSPAIDAGYTTGLTFVDDADAADATRQRRTIDIGAYEFQDFRVAATASPGVNITGSTEQFVASGANVNFTFTLSSGFSTPIKVNETEVALTPDGQGVYTYTLNNVTEDKTIIISATASVSYDVTVNATNVNIISPTLDVNDKFQYPAQFEITFELNEGYENPEVTSDGASYTLGAPINDVYTITLTGLTDNTTVAITATIKQFDVTVNTDGIDGTPSLTTVTNNKANYGSNVTVSFAIASGKNYPYATVNGVYQALTESSGTYSFTIANVTEAKNINLTGYYFAENVLPVTEDTYNRYNSNISGYYASSAIMESRGSGGYACTPLLKFVPTDAQKAAGYNKVTLKLVPQEIANSSSYTYKIGQVPATYATINDVPSTVNVNAGNLGAWTQVGTESGSIVAVVNTPVSLDVTDNYVLDMPDEIRLAVFRSAGNNIFKFHSLENGNPAYIPVLEFAYEAPADGSVDMSYYQSGDIVIKSNDNETGTLTGLPDDGLQVNGKVKLVKEFTVANWYPVGFPFEIENISITQGANTMQGKIYCGDVGNQTFSNTGEENDNFFVKYYDGEENVFKFTNNIEANKGYIVEFPEIPFLTTSPVKVTFTSVPNPILYINKPVTPDVYETYHTLVVNPNVNKMQYTSFQNATFYYQYNYANSFIRTTSPDDLKPFEAMVVYRVGEYSYSAYSVIGSGNDVTGITTHADNDKIVRVEYYDLLGAPVKALHETSLPNGIYIVKTVYESGKSKVSKIRK